MSKSILLIEDNLEVRENTQELLELANYKVESAENGKVGVKMALANPPDLILCDIMMPVMDGYEVLYILSKNLSTKNIPFIFLTAKAEKSDRRKGMSLGADDYLVKPFEEMELLEAIEVRFKKQELFKDFIQQDQHSIEDLTQLLDAEKRDQLMSANRIKNLDKKEMLYREGDSISKAFYVESGKIRTYMINPDGKEFTSGLYSGGDFVGYVALINGGEHQVDNAQALEASTIRSIDRSDFNDLLFKNRDMAHAFIKLLSKNIIEKEHELLNLAYNSVRKRVANSLVNLYNKYGEDGDDTFGISISRDELASLVGTSTESVIRVLSDFKEEGLVEIESGEIKIPTPKDLLGIYG